MVYLCQAMCTNTFADALLHFPTTSAEWMGLPEMPAMLHNSSRSCAARDALHVLREVPGKACYTSHRALSSTAKLGLPC